MVECAEIKRILDEQHRQGRVDRQLLETYIHLKYGGDFEMTKCMRCEKEISQQEFERNTGLCKSCASHQRLIEDIKFFGECGFDEGTYRYD